MVNRSSESAESRRGRTARIHITDDFCRRAQVKPGQRVTVYSDSDTRGFCLVVTAGGAKTFAARYTLKEGPEAGKQVLVTLGPYLGRDGKAVATFRTEAAKAIGDAARGIDKAAKRAEVRKGATVAQLCERYLAEHAPAKRSAAMDRGRIDRYILPAWRNRKASSITRADVRTLLAPIEFGEPAKKTLPRPYEARGVLALVKKLFSFGIDAEVVTEHPAARMKIATPAKARERELSSAHDLRAFWALTEGDRYMPATYAAALRFQLLASARPNEAAGLPKAELDLDADEWTLPAARSKNKRPHLVPLTPALRSIIDAQLVAQATQRAEAKAAGKPFKESKFVFPATRGGRYTDKCRKNMLDDALKAYNEEDHKLERFTPHDLRRTAETAMAAAGVSKEHRDRVQNHVDNSVGGKHYNLHDYKAEKLAALQTLENYIQAKLDPKGKSNVVKFPAKAG